GAPVFAISNLSNEQLDTLLMKESIATAAQIDEAKQQAGKANQLGTILVRMGVISEDRCRELVCSQVMRIILSLCEWKEGDYVFDERIRAVHDVMLRKNAADILLEGARHIAADQEMAEALAPMESILSRARNGAGRQDNCNLLPVESYVLSRIESPAAVSEIGPLTGLPDEEARRAVCALVAAGLLDRLDDKKEEAEEKEGDYSLTRLREDISRKLHFYTTADYYEMLGVTRQATTADVKAAYYQLAKKYHPDRYRQAEHAELRGKLEALFARITLAYETLKEPASRASYDDRLRKPGAQSQARDPLATTPLVLPEERKATGDLAQHAVAAAASSDVPASEQPAAQEPQQQTARAASPAQSAEQYYLQGRARFDRKEYHAAVHLLREAVKLDSSKPQYHFHLGIALIRNPRTRREAEDHLARAAELDPYNAQIRVKLGMLYKEAGLTKKSESYFRQAMQLDPENRVAARELAAEKKKEPIGSIWKADFGTIFRRLLRR
ncbi:MAG TPA: DnaJ domain-containing protein, partial [Blastocatellia bacterium]|nr:DnaJ domain-containing protein [Blastocatellia bacterium]